MKTLYLFMFLAAGTLAYILLDAAKYLHRSYRRACSLLLDADQPLKKLD